MLAQLSEIAPRILPYSDAVWALLDDVRREGKRILFEGAQGILLDIDHGTYPYVTSSNTVAGQAAAGSGLGPSAIGYVLGIAKAYTTRVGSGPFPTEQENDIGEYIGQRGREFGTVTGRKRRCGWFDSVLVRQAIKTGGIHGIALTKLDVLDGLEEIKVGVGYELDGKRIDRFPAAEEAQKRVVPIYESFEGWKGTTAGAQVLGAASGSGHQVCEVSRRADRVPGGAALDLARARRHDPDEGSIRGLTGERRNSATAACCCRAAAILPRICSSRPMTWAVDPTMSGSGPVTTLRFLLG